VGAAPKSGDPSRLPPVAPTRPPARPSGAPSALLAGARAAPHPPAAKDPAWVALPLKGGSRIAARTLRRSE